MTWILPVCPGAVAARSQASHARSGGSATGERHLHAAAAAAAIAIEHLQRVDHRVARLPRFLDGASDQQDGAAHRRPGERGDGDVRQGGTGAGAIADEIGVQANAVDAVVALERLRRTRSGDPASGQPILCRFRLTAI